MTGDAQRARRRARNTHALAQCNGMGRTAGSTLWQPLVRKDGKYFMPDGAELSEPPVEFRSERLDTILDEMDAVDAVVPTPVMQPLKEWKAEVEAALQNGPVDLTAGVLSDVGDVRKMVNGPIMPAAAHWFEPPAGYVRPEPPNLDFLVSLAELEKAIVNPKEPTVADQTDPQPPEPMLQFFAYAHLPAHLRDASRIFGDLAETIVRDFPRNPERTVALRKLLEAKDCAVRAMLYK